MTARPTRATTAGRAYLDLRRAASAAGRPTDELQQLYALEGFLDRLGLSPYTNRFVLKGGVLLAAFDARRPTRDVDLAATGLSGELDDVRQVVCEIVGVKRADGLEFFADQTSIEAIRDEDAYGGCRVTIHGTLSTATIQFHADVNFGDPLWPLPEPVDVPRVLGGTPIRLRGYRVELVLAEKIVTAVQRGTANTRWRDFVDIANLSSHQPDEEILVESISLVAAHRQTSIRLLEEVLDGYPPLAQQRWAGCRRKQRLAATTPESFATLLDQVINFSDPVLGRVLTQAHLGEPPGPPTSSPSTTRPK